LMDNYKIINTHTNEIIKALNDLGYVWTPKKFDEQDCLLKAHWILAKEKGEIAYSSGTHIDSPLVFTELTLPQLQDLVVLKRNDVKDATHEDQYGDKWLYLDERHYVYLNDQWDLPIGEFLERYELKPILPVKNQDPALFSIDDVWKAFWKNQKVQYSFDDDNNWQDDIESLKIEDIKSGHYQFRLKPQTIKLELELPKPFEPKVGEEVFYINDTNKTGYCVDEHQAHYNYNFGVWRTEAEVKQVVEQLRKIRGAS
ncbi:TPA: hypothetical protein ACNICD_003254, partial [Acinetobacter baumannii]